MPCQTVPSWPGPLESCGLARHNTAWHSTGRLSFPGVNVDSSCNCAAVGNAFDFFGFGHASSSILLCSSVSASNGDHVER